MKKLMKATFRNVSSDVIDDIMASLNAKQILDSTRFPVEVSTVPSIADIKGWIAKKTTQIAQADSYILGVLKQLGLKRNDFLYISADRSEGLVYVRYFKKFADPVPTAEEQEDKQDA